MVHTTMATSRWTEPLRAAGLRVTAPRLAVLEALDELEGDHPDVVRILEAVRARLGAASIQSVYNSLEALGRAGLVRRIEPAGSPARFETRVGDNHHHVVCRACGATADIDCVVGAAPCITPEAVAGFSIDEAEVTFWGLCPSCRPRSKRAPRPKTTHNPSRRRP
jgi:Fur family ferric uptake transcriptional regulator